MEKIRIVIVDDHNVMRQGLARMLSLEPNLEVVAEFEYGEELLNSFKNINCDTIIMDVQLKGISGIETTARLKEMNPEVKVIMLSMFENDEFIFESLKAGASGYIPKDATMDELIKAINAVNSGDALLYPSVTRKVIDKFSKLIGNKELNGAEDMRLSRQEIHILGLVSEGLSNKEIASNINIAEPTVKAHLRQIFRKMEVVDRAQAVAKALRRGLIK